jgi:hypothetical protein
MEVVPRDVAFAVARMEGYNSNVFRLETNGATSAGPNSIITMSLPSNAVIDLRSFKVHLDVSTTLDDTAANTIYGKLPADSASLIQSCEVYCGGIQIAQGFSEFNTVSRVKKIVYSNRDRESSIDQTLYHGIITADNSIDTVSMIFKPNIGFFAETSTRYLPTSILGDISVRLTLAPNSVLAYKEEVVAPGGNFTSNAARVAAQSISYSVTSIHATIATCTLGAMYETMLLDRLSQEEYLAINFKEYYTFGLHGTNSTAHDVRFSLSASSIDRIYTVCRDSNYQSAGIKTQAYTGATLSDSNCSNYLHFKSYNDSFTTRGSLRYQYQVNNVQHPQFSADCLDAAHELLMVSDGHGNNGRGNMITSLQDWNNGKAIVPLQLSMPGQPVNVMAGYNSRGNNTQFSVSISGQTMPAANVDAQISGRISTLVIVETTAQLRISGAKQVSVSY